jgi:hypothetical protein
VTIGFSEQLGQPDFGSLGDCCHIAGRKHLPIVTLRSVA